MLRRCLSSAKILLTMRMRRTKEQQQLLWELRGIGDYFSRDCVQNCMDRCCVTMMFDTGTSIQYIHILIIYICECITSMDTNQRSQRKSTSNLKYPEIAKVQTLDVRIFELLDTIHALCGHLQYTVHETNRWICSDYVTFKNGRCSMVVFDIA